MSGKYTVKSQLKKEIGEFNAEMRESMTNKHGSVAKAWLYVFAGIFKWVALIFAAFIAAILNLARKS